jgi:O-antigen ligase
MIATPSAVDKVPHETEPTPMLKIGFYSFCLFNLAYYSRFFEWKLSFLHVPLITSSLALLGAAMDGRLLWTFRSKIGTCMAALTVIYAIGLPLSVWRSRSFQTFTAEWLKAVIAFMIAGALVVTFKQCRTALNSIGWGVAVASLLAIYVGRTEYGRLQLGSGTLSNANGLAFILLLGLPFLWLMASASDAPKFKRLVAFCFTLTTIYASVRTGSRAGLIGLLVLFLLFFLRASIIGKLTFCVGVAAFSLCVFSFFPAIVQRYETMFVGAGAISQAHTAREASALGAAVGSSEARRKLLINSLKVTAEHPLLGVGINGFGAYMAKKETAEGIIPRYQGTHNTYTQVSSEAGIPALIIFLCIMIFSFQGLLRVYKRAKKSPTKVGRQVADVCYALISTLTAYAVCVFFDYVAYDATLPVLAGFAIALGSAARNALAVAEYNQATAPVVAQAVVFPVRQRYASSSAVS